MNSFFKPLIFGIILFSSFRYQAQETIVIPDSFMIIEGNYPMKGIERNGFQTSIHGEHKKIIKSLKSFLKSNYSLRLKSRGTYLTGEDLYNSALSDKHFSLTIECTGSKLTAWMGLGTDVLVNSTIYPAESQKVEKMLKDFLKNYYTTFLLDEQKTNEKEVKKLSKAANRSEKSLSKQEKSLTKIKKSIAKTERSLTKNKAKLAKLSDQITTDEKNLVNYNSKKGSTESEIISTERTSSSETNQLEEAQRRLDAVKIAIIKVNGF